MEAILKQMDREVLERKFVHKVPDEHVSTLKEVVGLLDNFVINEITNDNEYQEAQKNIQRLRKAAQDLSESKKGSSIELYNRKKELDGCYKECEEMLASTRKQAGQKVLDYEASIEQQRREAERKAEEGLRKALDREKKKLERQQERANEQGKEFTEEMIQNRIDDIEVTAPPAPSIAEPTKIKGSQRRIDYDVKVTDIDEVPEAYLKPREADVQLLKMAKRRNSKLQVKGVEFTETKKVI